MTDSEVLATIRAIIARKPRHVRTPEERDLSRYDQILGVLTRHPSTTPKTPARRARSSRIAAVGSDDRL